MNFTKVADHLAAISDATISGQEITKGDDSDWTCNLPITYNDETTTIRIASTYATVTATAADESDATKTVEVTANGDDTFTLPTPAAGTATIVTFNVTADANAIAFQETYTMRLFHIGDVIVKSLLIDGIEAPAEILASLNAEGDAAVAEHNTHIFTQLPVVEAIFADNTKVTASVNPDGEKATYTFSGVAGDKSKNYTLTISGIHIYEASDADELVTLRYVAANVANDAWHNGSYGISPCNDGWEGYGHFKFRRNQTTTLSVPEDVIVKQVKFNGLRGTGNPGKITDFASEGATVYLPTASEFKQGDGDVERELTVNLENHKAGTPITFYIQEGNQPVAHLQLLVQHDEGTTGIEDAVADGEIVSTVYYNLQGVEVSADAKGTVIRVQTLANGTRRTAKLVK